MILTPLYPLSEQCNCHHAWSVSVRVDWMLLYQGMVVLAANQVWWTWEVEAGFENVKRGEKNALKNYAKKLHQQIDELVKHITQPIKKNDRRKLNTVLIVDVHARDIVDNFVFNRCLLSKQFYFNICNIS